MYLTRTEEILDKNKIITTEFECSFPSRLYFFFHRIRFENALLVHALECTLIRIDCDLR